MGFRDPDKDVYFVTTGHLNTRISESIKSIKNVVITMTGVA